MTKTMFFRRGGRLDGAKNWTKCPSETWRGHSGLRGSLIWLQCGFAPTSRRYLELPGVAVSLHVVLDGEHALDGRFRAVPALFLLLKRRFEGDMSLWTRRHRHRDNLTSQLIAPDALRVSSREPDLVLGLGHVDEVVELASQLVLRKDPGDAVGLKDVDVHLRGGQVSERRRPPGASAGDTLTWKCGTSRPGCRCSTCS